MIDETHDVTLRSWVESANDPANDFPIQNLPLGAFTLSPEREPRAAIGVPIGNQLLDLGACVDKGLLRTTSVEPQWFRYPALNPIMSSGRKGLREIRRAVSALLRHDAAERGALAACLLPLAEARPHLPARIGDYTDFYASVHHATNVGSMFRPDNPLLPNYKWVPIGYHGRSSSIVPSGTPIRRPQGQTREGEAPPTFGPSTRLDYEMEIGAFVGPGNEMGRAIELDAAEEHLFGLCIVNDWSARDLQTWEYQPLGPFLAKNFATTISPWIITVDALEPFRTSIEPRAAGDPEPLPYLRSESDARRGGFDITVEVSLQTARMRELALSPQKLSRSNLRSMYWTFGQMLAHHSSNGCNLRPGDLLASGTVSGPEKSQRGCLLELTWRGTEPLELPTGETRRFLEDGDEVTMRAWCEREGFARIGFGDCVGRIQS